MLLQTEKEYLFIKKEDFRDWSHSVSDGAFGYIRGHANQLFCRSLVVLREPHLYTTTFSSTNGHELQLTLAQVFTHQSVSVRCTVSVYHDAREIRGGTAGVGEIWSRAEWALPACFPHCRWAAHGHVCIMDDMFAPALDTLPPIWRSDLVIMEVTAACRMQITDGLSSCFFDLFLLPEGDLVLCRDWRMSANGRLDK